MKKLIGALVASSLLFSASAFADVAVGIIDLPNILQNSSQAQAINQKLQEQFKPQQEQILAAQNKIRTEAQKLAPGATKLTEEQQQTIKTTITGDQKSLQEMILKFQQQVGQAQETAMKTFMAQVDAAVKTVAQKDKLDMVLVKPAVVFATNATDVTQQVLAELPK